MYVKPECVRSPKKTIQDLMVIHDGGPDGTSYALIYDGEKVFLGMRTNGSDKFKLGFPQTRGIPTWLKVPDESKDIIINSLITKSKDGIDIVIDMLKPNMTSKGVFFMASIEATIPIHKLNLVLLAIIDQYKKDGMLELMVDELSPLPNSKLALYKGMYYFGLRIN